MKITEIKKISLTLFYCLFSLFIFSQRQAVGTWRNYSSYYEAVKAAQTPNKVFAIYKGAKIPTQSIETRYDGSLLSYSIEDQEIKLYSKADGLNDIDIQELAYNNQTNALILVYQNANIDIMTENGTFNNIPFIKNNTYFQDKTVNNLEINGSEAYISTNFGIVVIDLARREVKATYDLGKKTYSTCIYKNYIYASTENGILRALLSSNLLDKNNWIQFDKINPYLGITNIQKILVYKDHLLFFEPSNSVYFMSEDEIFTLLDNDIGFRKMNMLNDQLIVINDRTSEVIFYPELNKNQSITFKNLPINDISSYGNKNNYWVASGTSGLIGIKINESSSEYQIIASGITINSPKRNITYSLTFDQNKLLVVGGSRASNRADYHGTLMVLENGEWYNFDEDKISRQISDYVGTELTCRDLISAVIDPNDPNRYFVSSWGEGVYEFKDNEFVALYNEQNSTLRSVLPNYPHTFIRVSGLAFDSNNNLYMINSDTDNAINIYTADKKWISYSNSELTKKPFIGTLLLTGNQKWVTIPRSGVGLFVLDDNGTINNTYDDNAVFQSKFITQDNRDLDPGGILCITEDLNGTIWVGTSVGPITFSRSSFSNGLTTCNRPKVPKNDGTNNADYLLDNQTITAIAVDGGNRKWIGTSGSGLFLVSSTGDEVLEYFTSENSLLISDIINSIAINNETGEVFVATDKGLVSYMGDAITGKPDYSNVYAFPNPIRPHIEDKVVITGLIEDSNVKITDLTGNIMIQGKSVGGQFTWNCRNYSGQIVKSGVYLVLASTQAGNGNNVEGVATKIVVVR